MKISALMVGIALAWGSSANADTLINVVTAVVTACPQVIGVSIADWSDKSSWRIDYAPGTTCQAAAQAAVTAYVVQPTLSVIPYAAFISRWTVAEYAKLLQGRAAAVTSGNVTLMQQFDIFSATGVIDLNNPAVTTAKAQIVTAGILTQARADVIFS